MINQETILIIDFGGQFNQLIARRVREANVYSVVVPYDVSLDRVKGIAPKGIIFTGGPDSVFEADAPQCDPGIYDLGIPILGIGYGAQLMATQLQGVVQQGEARKSGKETLTHQETPLFKDKDIPAESKVWMSPGNAIATVPQGFQVTAATETHLVAAMENADKQLYGIQFSPEVKDTECGTQLLRNFMIDICGCQGLWTIKRYIEEEIAAIREKVGDKKVLCALSGGVDSSVAAALVHKAIGDQLYCIFVDHGLMRKNEGDQVEETFSKKFNMNFVRVNAEERFLGKLAGVTDPEKKRKIIGEEFIRVFEEEAAKLTDIDFLLQGTIYPDVIESGTKDAAVIKSHHNVGGLPEDIEFKLIEPLRELFKDEVRLLGEELGLAHELVWRQPFPGPGLGIRVIGEVTKEKLDILREADYVFRDEIAKNGLDKEIWQYFAVLPGVRSVGVSEDERTYDYTIGLRAVYSTDGMTSDWARIPFDVMEKISNRIVNECAHVNRIVYDVTSKPPSTIEWE